MLASATGIRADRREMEADEKSAMKQLVVSALAYYGLKVYHVFDGLRFRPSFQLIEIDQRKAVEEFGAAVQADENGVLDEFAREFCWTDRVAIPSLAGPSGSPSSFRSLS